MNFYRQRDCPTYPATHVFRESRLPSLVTSLSLLGFALAWALAAPRLSEDSFLAAIFAVVIASSCGLGALMYAAMLRASLGSGNWLMRYSPDGVLINLRSFQNAHLPDEDPTVVWISTSEIASIQKRTVTHLAPRQAKGSKRETRKTNVFVDLRIRGADTGPLNEAIETEKQRSPAGRGVKSRANHTAVWVPEPGLVRIAWRGAAGWLTPSAEGAIEAFGPFVSVLEPVSLEHDYRKLEAGELDDHIVELVLAGETLSAATIARLRYGMGLTEARRFIADLLGKRAPSPAS